MIVTGRSIDAQQVGNVGTWVNNVIFKLPHNGDLIGPIEINDDHNQQVQRFSYTPAVCVRSWEDVKYDTQIAYGSGMETFKLLRTCALWNTTNQAPTSPTSLGSVTTQLTTKHSLVVIHHDWCRLTLVHTPLVCCGRHLQLTCS